MGSNRLGSQWEKKEAVVLVPKAEEHMVGVERGGTITTKCFCNFVYEKFRIEVEKFTSQLLERHMSMALPVI
ncbi:hypothetical protein V6N11_069528 [Hibiscus sabdariffa]|uniref:Uncharacterized protein n=1 Tax=Hibiscus sabdariffa TaxID=183260 RepID=A0ABR2Q311_9ROSI